MRSAISIPVAALALLVGVCGSAPTAAAPVTRSACIVAQPPEWMAAIADSRIDTGGVSTTARAVAPGGEVLAVRDNGDTRDLLLIGPDRSVRELYSVPEPDTFDIGYAGIDDRWVVFARDRIPRNSNGVLPTVERIEIMDRRDGSIRTVATQSADSVALHDGRVYWLTLPDYTAETGTVRSFDPVTGTTIDAESGVGQLNLPAEPPAALRGIADADRGSMSTDGTAFGWIVGVENGGTGVGYWSPEAGVVAVTGLALKIDRHVPAVFVHGPFVILDKGFGGRGDNYAIVVDTRTGAVTGLERRPDTPYDRAVSAHAGVLAIDVWSGPGKGDYSVGALGVDAWSPLAC